MKETSEVNHFFSFWKVVFVKSLHKWNHFKIEPEQPFQSNCIECLTLWTFRMFELGKITFGQGQITLSYQQLLVNLIGKQTS